MRGKTPKAAGRLILCGLGVSPPRFVTLDIMEALERCDVLFVNLSGDTLVEFLSLFCRDIRPINFHTEEDAERCAELITTACREGKTAAYVTMGNAMVFGPLSARLITECRRLGIDCAARPSLSAMDLILAAMGQVLGHGFNGFQVYDVAELLDARFSPDPGIPTAFFFTAGPARMDFKRYQAALLKHYPGDAQGYLFWGVLGQERPTIFPLKSFSKHRREINSCAQLFIPPAQRGS